MIYSSSTVKKGTLLFAGHQRMIQWNFYSPTDIAWLWAQVQYDMSMQNHDLALNHPGYHTVACLQRRR